MEERNPDLQRPWRNDASLCAVLSIVASSIHKRFVLATLVAVCNPHRQPGVRKAELWLSDMHYCGECLRLALMDVAVMAFYQWHDSKQIL
ncbi:Hypothetical predicted protein [Olea europaea subsp. europaea]|uniref:Uncharacterized protein n=1 Tax=Olea europaea subsp. europaea TaxID=158383 RepID=A0A8S0SHF8_OLEEU|nr:Hypothetical predicted protein [Olea europaea subsp. europaea]